MVTQAAKASTDVVLYYPLPSQGSFWLWAPPMRGGNAFSHWLGPCPERSLSSFPGITHWGRETHTCVGKLTIIASDNGLSPSHYLNQCWNIVNWTLGNKLQWNFNGNSYIFIQENALENVVCEMASILSRPQCVKPTFAPEGQTELHWLVPISI